MTDEEYARWSGTVDARLDEFLRMQKELRVMEHEQNMLLRKLGEDVAAMRGQARVIGAIAGALSGVGAWALSKVAGGH